MSKDLTPIQLLPPECCFLLAAAMRLVWPDVNSSRLEALDSRRPRLRLMSGASCIGLLHPGSTNPRLCVSRAAEVVSRPAIATSSSKMSTSAQQIIGGGYRYRCAGLVRHSRPDAELVTHRNINMKWLPPRLLARLPLIPGRPRTRPNSARHAFIKGSHQPKASCIYARADSIRAGRSRQERCERSAAAKKGARTRAKR
jgi:hypothetical protein